MDAPRTGTGRSPVCPAAQRAAGPHREGRMAVADDARAGEVRLRHSSNEVREQSRAAGCGADGAKVGSALATADLLHCCVSKSCAPSIGVASSDPKPALGYLPFRLLLVAVPAAIQETSAASLPRQKASQSNHARIRQRAVMTNPVLRRLCG